MPPVPSPLESPAVSPRASRWNRRLFAAAVLLSAARLMAMNQADPDLWGHTQYGRDLLHAGALPWTTTWSFTSDGYPWVNHEILAEVLLAAAEDLCGPLGLTVGKYLLSVAVLGLLYWNARRQGVAPGLIGALCVVTALAMEFHWHFRPQALGYFFFVILLWLLGDSFANWRDVIRGRAAPAAGLTRLLWLWPLMALWANTHGSFPAGVCVALATLGLRGVELATIFSGKQRSNFESAPHGGRPLHSCVSASPSTRSLLIWLIVIAAGVALAPLVNPYGANIYVWLWDALHVPCAEIDDWERLPLFGASREALCCWIILATTAVTIALDRRRDWTAVIVFALVAWQSLSHVRHLPMLALAWACWFAVPMQRVLQDFLDGLPKTAPARDSNRARAPFRACVDFSVSMKPTCGSPGDSPGADYSLSPSLVDRVGRDAGTASSSRWLAPLALSAWIALALVQTWPKLSRLDVDAGQYPVQAMQFLAAHRLAGRTVVTFNWAQYAIGCFAHAGLKSTVAVDGRYRTCYSQEVLDRYFDFTFGPDYQGPRYRSPSSGPVDPRRALTCDDPELVLVSRLQRPSVRVMEQHQANWSLLYQDGLSQIWGRKDLFDSPRSSRYLPVEERLIEDQFPRGVVAYPAYPSDQRPHDVVARR